ncbi:hypothetical protein E1211_24820 [Micromonospora sp. 15K316]|uniref:hypothetical protein n=1 Tax=Micromonospora sp. 15K316 TaxID=2530376 RepID=UPI001051889B|nr:hypothetical protein [Micromonospora sp. 15K316]TDC30073.1 hypothetical protein E1211_24820 [Micromonospora sp. 15K316]
MPSTTRRTTATVPQARRAPASTARNREEDELLGTTFDLAQRLGLLAYHPLPAQIRPGRYVTAAQGSGAKGFLDAVFAGPGGQLYREFKATDGSVTPEQQRWMDMLDAGGADVGVWRPVDLVSGRITAELNSIRRPRRPFADVDVFRAALEQIRDANPEALSTSALLASVQQLAADALAGNYHTLEVTRG